MLKATVSQGNKGTMVFLLLRLFRCEQAAVTHSKHVQVSDELQSCVSAKICTHQLGTSDRVRS